MITQVFTVFDSKTLAYLPPFFAPTPGAAMRSFIDAVGQSGHEFNKHPEDYTLFHLGSFDDCDGTFANLETKKSLGVASEVKAIHFPDPAPSRRPDMDQ